MIGHTGEIVRLIQQLLNRLDDIDEAVGSLIQSTQVLHEAESGRRGSHLM
jgi:hypothetical protein